MAVTESTFKAKFPEFAGTATVIVERSIEAATYATGDLTAFGDAADLAVSYMAAHILLQDPKALGAPYSFDANGNLKESKDGSSTGTSQYLNAYMALRKSHVLTFFCA